MSGAGVDLGIPGLRDAEAIGTGGFGTVYRAFQPEFNRAVAVKVLRDPLTDEGVRRRFARECQAMGMLSSHPNIVTVYQGGLTEAGLAYIVMDYMAGGSLGERLKRSGRLPWQEVLDVAVTLAGGLAAAHDAEILHRDLKPENILLSGYGEAKLADFGIARIAGGAETRSGVLTASVAHAAPELFDGARPSVASDLYGLGSTLFTLLSGRLAFVRDTDESMLPVMWRIHNEPVPDLRAEGVPSPVCQTVERLMAKKPGDRYATAEELGRTAQGVQRASGVPVSRLTLAGGAVGGAADVTAARSAMPPPAPPQPLAAPVGASTGPTDEPPSRPPSNRAGLVAGIVGALLTLAIVGLGIRLLTGGPETPVAPSPVPSASVPVTPSPSSSPTPSPTPSATAQPSVPTPTPAPAQPVLLAPSAVDASGTAPPGVDGAGNPVSYGPEHLVDRDPTTAWRVEGNGAGHELRVTFPQPVRLRRIGMIPGYAKVDPADGTDRFTQNRILRSARYAFDDGSSILAGFAPQPALQFTDVDVVTQSVTITFTGTTEHGGRDFTAVSEIELYGVPA